MSDAEAILSRAVAEWNRGDHYDAHETLEDFADLIEDDDREHAIAIALIHVAAALHKWVNDVGKNAVPSKIEGALATLAAAPSPWRGLDLGRLSSELRAMLAAITAQQAPVLPKL